MIQLNSTTRRSHPVSNGGRRGASLGGAFALSRGMVMDDCIRGEGWVGTNGHLTVRVGGKRLMARRVAWEASNGTIPDGRCVVQSCRNKLCVNPAHLVLSPWRKYGRSTPDAVRFWRLVDKSGGDDACWPWTGSPSTNGYGQFGIKSRKIPAHRLAYLFHFGHIDPALLVCHRCDNPPCCNPAHLFLGNHTDNARDMIAKGRAGWQKASRR